MQKYLDILLNDHQISEIIKSQQESYFFSQLNIQQPTSSDLEKVLRIVYLLINHTLSPEFKIEKNSLHSDLIDKTYLLLSSINIKDEKIKASFEKICGIDEIDVETLYYYYLASLGLKNNQTIKIRIDLKAFSPTQNTIVLSDWKLRVLNKTLEAFILLVRKQEGFADINKSLDLIIKLRNEQKDFESNYLNQSVRESKLNREKEPRIKTNNEYQIREDEKFKEKFLSDDKSVEFKVATSLLGIYHISKTISETADYLIQGYSYRGNIGNIIRQHADLALKLLENEPRLMSIVNILESNLKILQSNSIWARTNFNDKIKKLCEFKAEKQGVIELLPSQIDAISQRFFDTASSVTVLQMPTSAGKTLLAEFYILQTKSLQKEAKVIYIVPSRALVNQVYYDLKSDLEELDLIIEKTSSAIEIDPSEWELLESDKIDILVSTPEKLDLLIRRNHPSVENLSLIVLDEAHSISSGSRGTKLELLMAILKREKPNAKFLLLSPFLGETGQENIAGWLAGEDRNKITTPIKVDWKPAEKLTVGIKVNSSKKKEKIKFTLNTLPSPYTIIKEEKEVEILFPNISKTGEKDKVFEFSAKHFIKKDKTMLYLCAGKKSADNRAKLLSEFCEDDLQNDDRSLVKKFIEEEIGRPTLLSKILDKRIAVHHAGLSDEIKLLIEHLIRQKQIKYVCATTTIGEGVNFPVSSVFFDSFEKGRGNGITTNDFWNIAGRAGRTLIDNFGIIIFPFTGDKNEERTRELIRKASDELKSCLIEFLVDADEIIEVFRNTNFNPLNNQIIQKYENSLEPLIQYLIHLLLVGDTYYVSEIEDLFKDSLGYYILDQEKKKKFLQICRTIYNYLNGQNKGMLTFADKTGFSVPSVLQVMREKRNNSNVNDLNSWKPEILFNEKDSKSLAEKIKIIAHLKETRLGTESDKSLLNADLIAQILIKWVKGDKLANISEIHPFFKQEYPDEGDRINEFVKKINDMRFKTSWGLSALEGIVRENEEDIKDSFVPSYIYFGVDNEKSLLLRMVGIPRSLSNSMSQMLGKDIRKYTYGEVRSNIKKLNIKEWENLIPKNSKLNAEEWKKISEILVR